MLLRTKTRRGFTLVEIMIAMGILGMSMIGTVSFMRWILRATDLSGRISTANVLTVSKLDQLIASQATAGGSASQNGYNQTWTISSSGTVRYVSVTTSYTGIESADHAVTLRQVYAP